MSAEAICRRPFRASPLLAAASIALVSLAASTPARATTITYVAVDLPDGPNGDLWRYDYRVSERAFLALDGFRIFFPHEAVPPGGLGATATAPSADWDIIALQPDPLLADDGVFDALALIDDPASGGTFSIEFVWTGPAVPASQGFEIYDDQFAVLEVGTTLADSVPEPASAISLLQGVLILVVLARHRQ